MQSFSYKLDSLMEKHTNSISGGFWFNSSGVMSVHFGRSLHWNSSTKKLAFKPKKDKDTSRTELSKGLTAVYFRGMRCEAIRAIRKKLKEAGIPSWTIRNIRFLTY